MAEVTECEPCAHAHPKNGCADVSCVHNCEAWITGTNAAKKVLSETQTAYHLQVES